MAKQLVQLTLTYFYEANSPEEHLALFGDKDRGGYSLPQDKEDVLNIEQYILSNPDCSLSVEEFMSKVKPLVSRKPAIRIELLPEWFSNIIMGGKP